MNSPRKDRSNRRNALRSTGPKTPAGKRKSSLNAKVHGLSSTPVFNGADYVVIKLLVDEFLQGSEWNPRIQDIAERAAENQIMVMRVNVARQDIWSGSRSRPEILDRGKLFGGDEQELGPGGKILLRHFRQTQPHMFEPPCDNGAEIEVLAFKLVSNDLLKMVRYERKFVNARDRAFRELEEAMCEFTDNNPPK